MIIAVVAAIALAVGVASKGFGSFTLGFTIWLGLAFPLRGALRDTAGCLHRHCWLHRRLLADSDAPLGESYLIHRARPTEPCMPAGVTMLPEYLRKGPLLHTFLPSGMRDDVSFRAPSLSLFSKVVASVHDDGSFRLPTTKLDLRQYWVRRLSRVGASRWLIIPAAAVTALLFAVVHVLALMVSFAQSTARIVLACVHHSHCCVDAVI